MFNPRANWLGGVQMAKIMARAGVRMVRDNTAENRKVRDVGRIQLNPTNAMKTKDTKAATWLTGKSKRFTDSLDKGTTAFSETHNMKGYVHAVRGGRIVATVTAATQRKAEKLAEQTWGVR